MSKALRRPRRQTAAHSRNRQKRKYVPPSQLSFARCQLIDSRTWIHCCRISVAEIVSKMNIGQRAVERKLQLIRDKWKGELLNLDREQ